MFSVFVNICWQELIAVLWSNWLESFIFVNARITSVVRNSSIRSFNPVVAVELETSSVPLLLREQILFSPVSVAHSDLNNLLKFASCPHHFWQFCPTIFPTPRADLIYRVYSRNVPKSKCPPLKNIGVVVVVFLFWHFLPKSKIGPTFINSQEELSRVTELTELLTNQMHGFLYSPRWNPYSPRWSPYSPRWSPYSPRWLYESRNVTSMTPTHFAV